MPEAGERKIGAFGLSDPNAPGTVSCRGGERAIHPGHFTYPYRRPSPAITLAPALGGDSNSGGEREIRTLGSALRHYDGLAILRQRSQREGEPFHPTHAPYLHKSNPSVPPKVGYCAYLLGR